MGSSSMRTLPAILALIAVLLPAAVRAEEPAPPADKPAKQKSPAGCTQLSTATISEAYGYKHLVSLRNGCDKPVECEVWTDVDPTPRHTLRVGPGQTVEVITRIGSPASAFKAFKECRFR